MANDMKHLGRILTALVEESGLRPLQVSNTVELLLEGGTVPFIARYRKERTGELDEVQIRTIAERLDYFSELEERRETILASIEEQGKLTPELRARIESVKQKTELEDLYLPYKPKRRTRAMIAKERGLEPLADLILAQELKSGSVEELALPFVDPAKDVADAQAALQGAGDIIAERVSEDAMVRAHVRRLTWEQGVFLSRVAPDHAGKVTKFEMYYDYREPIREIPSHRMLAMRRGEKEEILRLTLEAPEEQILDGIYRSIILGPSIFRDRIVSAVDDAYRRLIAPSIEIELRMESKKVADETAIKVFADNLRNLLLAAPAGTKRVLGVDPGLRTGSKLVVVDETGRLCEHETIYPHTGRGRVAEAAETLLRMVERYKIDMIAIGNGTASREMEQFVKECLAVRSERPQIIIVSESGASVYSASDVAREEFPELDVSVRGAVSIARRLQDPLAELVKIDPKSIGVGQYQHDVSQTALKRSLDGVVESCVNYVGVDLNTASAPLLSYVAGIGSSLAKAVVTHREKHGAYRSRRALLEVSRFGPKAFEQGAGFLRVRNGENPLDNTAVHPERYAIVERMAADLGVGVERLVAEPALVEKINLASYVDDQVGLPTLRDIVAELKKPGRDPRDTFTTAKLRDDIREISDLSPGMILQGTISNVTHFGAFVDIGVHQDGLVHVSHIANRFISDPAEVVKAGEVVTVKVLEVDAPRKRISLSIKEAQEGGGNSGGGKTAVKKESSKPQPQKEMSNNPFAGLAAAGFKVKQGNQKRENQKKGR